MYITLTAQNAYFPNGDLLILAAVGGVFDIYDWGIVATIPQSSPIVPDRPHFFSRLHEVW